MQRVTVLTAVILSLLMIGITVSAQQTNQSIPNSWVAGPSLGFGVSIPWLLTTNLTTAVTFVDTFAEVPLTLDLATRTTVRYYVSSTGLNLNLTSGQQSLLYFLNRGPVRFYHGAGVGIFPYEDSTFLNDVDQGFLLELHYLTGLKFNVAFFSIFGELMYELMPQPVVAQPDVGGTGTGVLSSFELTIGGQIHFSPACIPACAKIEKPAPAPCTPPC